MEFPYSESLWHDLASKEIVVTTRGSRAASTGSTHLYVSKSFQFYVTLSHVPAMRPKQRNRLRHLFFQLLQRYVISGSTVVIGFVFAAC